MKRIAVMACCGGVMLALSQLTAWGQSAPAPAAQSDIVLRCVPDGPVARVDQEAIAPDEFRDLYVAELLRLQHTGGQLEDIERMELAMRCLRMLIERSMLFQSAQQQGLAVTDEEVATAWKEEVERMSKGLAGQSGKPLSEEEILKLANTSRENALKELRRTMLIDKMRGVIVKKKNVTATDEEAKKYFDDNKLNNRIPDSVRIQQIYIKVPKTAGAPNPAIAEKARKEADNALARVKSGEKFEAVAKAVTQAPNKQGAEENGTQVAVDGLPAELRQPVMALAPGEVSPVITSEYGFHIVKMLEKVAGKEPTFEEMSAGIKKLLLAQRGNEAVREYCSEMKSEITIYIDFDREIKARPDLQEALKKLQKETDESAPQQPAAAPKKPASKK